MYSAKGMGPSFVVNLIYILLSYVGVISMEKSVAAFWMVISFKKGEGKGETE
jgi:hypothetical protein